MLRVSQNSRYPSSRYRELAVYCFSDVSKCVYQVSCALSIRFIDVTSILICLTVHNWGIPELQIRCVNSTYTDTIYVIFLLYPIFDHLLESSWRDDKWSNIGCGEEIGFLLQNTLLISIFRPLGDRFSLVLSILPLLYSELC